MHTHTHAHAVHRIVLSRRSTPCLADCFCCCCLCSFGHVRQAASFAFGCASALTPKSLSLHGCSLAAAGSVCAVCAIGEKEKRTKALRARLTHTQINARVCVYMPGMTLKVKTIKISSRAMCANVCAALFGCAIFINISPQLVVSVHTHTRTRAHRMCLYRVA